MSVHDDAPAVTGTSPKADGYIGQSNLLEILGRREAELNKRRIELAHALSETEGGLREVLHLRQLVTAARAAEPAAGGNADAPPAS